MRLYKRSDRWWCDFSTRGGDGGRRRHRVSLGLAPGASEREARARASELRAQVEQSELLDRAGLTPASAPSQPEEPAAVPFSGLARLWWQRGAPHWSPSTAHRYEATIRLYLVPWWGHRDAREITRGDVADLLVALGGRGLSASTSNGALCVLRSILASGVAEGLLARNVAADVRPVRSAPASAPEWYTAEEGEALLAAASKVRPDLAPLLRAALRTGLRAGELLALRWADVDLSGGFLVVRSTVIQTREGRRTSDRTKTGKTRRVPLTPDLAAALKAGQHLRAPWVFAREDGQQYTHRQLEGALRSAARAAGLRALRVHDLRHSFASQLIAAGASLQAVARLLGHSSVATTEIYAHLAPGALDEAVSLLGQVTGTNLAQAGKPTAQRSLK